MKGNLNKWVISRFIETGVWGSPVCEKISIPSVLKIQAEIIQMMKIECQNQLSFIIIQKIIALQPVYLVSSKYNIWDSCVGWFHLDTISFWCEDGNLPIVDWWVDYWIWCGFVVRRKTNRYFCVNFPNQGLSFLGRIRIRSFLSWLESMLATGGLERFILRGNGLIWLHEGFMFVMVYLVGRHPGFSIRNTPLLSVF